MNRGKEGGKNEEGAERTQMIKQFNCSTNLRRKYEQDISSQIQQTPECFGCCVWIDTGCDHSTRKAVKTCSYEVRHLALKPLSAMLLSLGVTSIPQSVLKQAVCKEWM